MNLRTVAQFSSEFPAFSQAALRWLIFRADQNGLQRTGAVVRVGRRVLIDVDAFFKWVRVGQVDPGLRPQRGRVTKPLAATRG